MKKTIGVFAHVDAGKTTFSEQLLFQTGATNSLGRVDKQTSFLDQNEIEQKRGITIFADQAVFHYGKDTYYLIDTPGHIDFSAETERTIGALDYAVLLINGSSGVQAHTTTLYRLLASYHIPVFFFVNKSDMMGVDLEAVLAEMQEKLTEDVLYLPSYQDLTDMNTEILEFSAERDERFLEAYLEDKQTFNQLQTTLTRLISERRAFPVMFGSALKGIGLDSFLQAFSELTKTSYDEELGAPFQGKVFKIRHDEKGQRVTFIKVLKGSLRVKDEFQFTILGEPISEKINGVRVYSGSRYANVQVAAAGEVVAVTGLNQPVCGTVIKAEGSNTIRSGEYYLEAPLQSKVSILDGTDTHTCLSRLQLLEDEDPLLSVSLGNGSEEILVNVMGKIQLEVLEQMIASRFGMEVRFEVPDVQYRETIAAPVVGYGHFEPLRHYAEVQIRLEPNERGKGLTFSSECPVDNLPLQFQRSVETHVFEKDHKGILTGSVLTDIHLVLQDGRAHEKHTEGGDFREATYRAIRQGMEKAASVLLEPYYQFEIFVHAEILGKVMSDIQKLRGTYEPPVQSGNLVTVKGRGPVATFMEYGIELVSFTKGNGNISLVFDGYDVCGNAEEAVERLAYEKERDMENLSSSVFCGKGTSFVVPWYEAEQYMHTR